MVKSYCIKEKKQNESVQPWLVTKKTKMAEQWFGVLVHHVVFKRPVLWKIRETSRHVCRGGRSVAGTALDMFVHHSLPWMGKKALEIRRCYGSEALRNPKLQKKAIYYTLDRLNPMIIFTMLVLKRWTSYQPN